MYGSVSSLAPVPVHHSHWLIQSNPHWFEVSEVSLHCLINRWQDGIHHGHNQEHIQRLQDCYLTNSLSKISTGGGNWESGEKIAANIEPSTMHSSVRVETKHCSPTFNLKHIILDVILPFTNCVSLFGDLIRKRLVFKNKHYEIFFQSFPSRILVGF